MKERGGEKGDGEKIGYVTGEHAERPVLLLLPYQQREVFELRDPFYLQRVADAVHFVVGPDVVCALRWGLREVIVRAELRRCILDDATEGKNQEGNGQQRSHIAEAVSMKHSESRSCVEESEHAAIVK